jgi:hypothetical protein
VRHQRQGFSQERRFIAIAWRRNKRRDDIAIAIAEGDDLVAFDLLVPAEPDVVAAFLRRCRRTIAMDDSGVDGGENPRIDGAVVSLEASFGFAETMMVRG